MTIKNNPFGQDYDVLNDGDTTSLNGGQQKCTSITDAWKAMTGLKPGAPAGHNVHDAMSFLLSYHTAWIGQTDIPANVQDIRTFLLKLPRTVRKGFETGSTASAGVGNHVHFYDMPRGHQLYDQNAPAVTKAFFDKRYSGTGSKATGEKRQESETVYNPGGASRNTLEEPFTGAHTQDLNHIDAPPILAEWVPLAADSFMAKITGNMQFRFHWDQTALVSLASSDAAVLESNLVTAASKSLMWTWETTAAWPIYPINADGAVYSTIDEHRNPFFQIAMYLLLRYHFEGLKDSIAGLINYMANPMCLAVYPGEDFTTPTWDRYYGVDGGDTFDDWIVANLCTGTAQVYTDLITSIRPSLTSYTKFTDHPNIANQGLSFTLCVPATVLRLTTGW